MKAKCSGPLAGRPRKHAEAMLPGWGITVSRRYGLARLAAVSAVTFAFCSNSSAVTCKEDDYRSHKYTVCEVLLADETLEIHWLDEDGRPFGSPRNLENWLARKGRRLQFAMNAGMFEPKAKLEPTGLLISNGKKLGEIRMDGWPGEKPSGRSPDDHFFRIPNGVFWVIDRKAQVTTSLAYKQGAVAPELAVQSGPLLLEDRRIPDAVIKEGRGMRRNGVCAPEPGRVLFAFANDGITIHEFASFFLDKTPCANALYLDGGRSVMQSLVPRRLDNLIVNRDGRELRVGAMIAVVEKAQAAKN